MSVERVHTHKIENPDRLDALHRTGLLDTPPEPAFDRLTTLAKRVLDVPIVLISLVDDRRQFFKSASGLSDPLASMRGTPLSHSFCQHVVDRSEPLIVEDAGNDPLVCSNGAFLDYSVVAYLGVPLITSDGFTLGSFAAIDTKPRRWTENDLAIVTDFAALTMTEIGFRAAIDQAQTAQRAQEEANRLLQEDISRRKEDADALRSLADKLKRSNDALQDFVSIASHDLQEPLRKILQFGNLLQTRQTEMMTPEARAYMERILRSADRMQKLIADLLSYSRVTSRAQPFREVELQEVVQATLPDLEAQIRRSGAVITVGCLPAIEGDPSQLRQLLYQLLENAIKFRRPDVTPTIHIEASILQQDSKAFCRLTVQDNGIGFEPRFSERIFDVFERLNEKERYPGTGIGLAICRRIVERHGGGIQAVGVPNTGATFTVLLPLHQSDGSSLSSDNKSVELVKLSLTGGQERPAAHTFVQKTVAAPTAPLLFSQAQSEEL